MFGYYSQTGSHASDPVSDALHSQPTPTPPPFTPDEDYLGGVEDTIEDFDHLMETAPPPAVVEVQVLHIFTAHDIILKISRDSQYGLIVQCTYTCSWVASA
jgi:hypothetical protein